ncbi:transketolase C-terminal domain-containing protein [Caballeronia sp. LZ001]|uniref:alpha-ketoacid dehydrogenase subunit beta n=1 Tax=Caballeronia sp. LZ001 TaxID=3038553 RepID=UPI00285F0531|nr:transketolase C-terminal domain-containing protein [Caballeronia sp. LZ001]MDR5804831.1 transketolase C-terminal domain-containing protein [Caballeronia sp. LZ001]
MATALNESVKVQEKSPNILQAINLALTDAMSDDSRVLVLGEDVGDPEGGGIVGITKGLETRFGNRVRSTPISEQAIVGAAIGAAIRGWRPVAEIMLMNFTTVAMDMIVNHAAKLRFMSGGQTSVPITIRTMTGAGRGSGGQHCDYLEAWFAHTAGMKVVAPSNPADAYGLLRSAIDDPDPVLFIENMPSYRAAAWGRSIAPGERVPLGKGLVVREGRDLTIVSYSRMVVEALAAAETLVSQGVEAEVIDLRTVSPWDRELVVASVQQTRRLMIVHEAVTPFGVGAEIAATVGHALFGSLKAPIERIGSAYCPVPFSKPLETAFAPSQGRIVEVAKAMVAS